MKYSYRGYETDPENGIVFGKRVNPIVKTCKGYVCIYPKSGNKKVILCHRAIWISANGEIPEGLQVNHINGIKCDNKISNLEIVTSSVNCLHAYSLGLSSANGENNGRAKLDKVKVLEILQLSGKFTVQEIAKKFGVCKTTIYAIFSKKRWDVDMFKKNPTP